MEESLKEYGAKQNEILPFVGSTFEKDSLTTLKRPSIIKYAPKSIELPKTYAEFNTHYFKLKCSLCNEYSQHLLSSICLICGKFMCQAYCPSINKVYGNLNKHAAKYHMGLGLFLDVQNLSKTLISTPVNFIFIGKKVYIDKFGQSIDTFLSERRTILYSLDFKTFTLNEEFVQYEHEVINSHDMGREVVKVAITKDHYYKPGSL